MIIEPKVRGFICTSAHPSGCFQLVKKQVDYVRKKGKFEGIKNALIIGSSTGYGLASRIVAAFACNAKTIGVFFEKPPSEKRTATAGWYNTAAFEKMAHSQDLYAKSINGDAFSHEIKQQTIELIKEDLKTIDLLVYSLASPRRVHPDTGAIYSSVLKPIGRSYSNKTVDPIKEEVKEITIEPANQEEIDNTIAVMGGDDWKLWVELLKKENLFSEGATTLAYTYIGPELTHPIYKNGTIGKAKDHLYETANILNNEMKKINGQALISVNKAIVTQASSAIPVVPLYISLLYKIMKEKGTHEGAIEQIYRMFHDKIFVNDKPMVDEKNRIRVDDLEMESDVQEKIAQLWEKVTTENLRSLTDIEGYREEFYHLFGFKFDEVNYDADVNPEVKVESIDDVKV